MKRIALVAVALMVAAALTGCSDVTFGLGGGESALFRSLPGQAGEDENYNKLADAFFDAVDARDAEAVKAFFADDVVGSFAEMDAQLAALFEIYTGPTEISARDGVSSGSYETDDGMRSSEVKATFAVVSGGEYYWCELIYMYENPDPRKIGISGVNFYAAADYCRVWYMDDASDREDFGLNVYADAPCVQEIRSICGRPYRYSDPVSPLDMEAAREFLSQSDSYPEFTARFGQPCAANPARFAYIYLLPDENGRQRYLMLSANLNNDAIFGAEIADDLKLLGNVPVVGK